MRSLWWQLPGPSKFVSKVVAHLRDGKNVVLMMPRHANTHLRQALNSALGDEGDWIWYRFDLAQEEIRSPIDLLYSRCVVRPELSLRRNAVSLSREESFAGKLIWVNNVDSESWREWQAFLTDYQHACRSQAMIHRTLFCVELVGEPGNDPPPSDVCLEVIPWHSRVDQFDMLLYAASLFREQRLPYFHKRLAISAVTQLAAFDPALAEHLAQFSLQEILNPFEILRVFAEERGWEGLDTENAALFWWEGIADNLGGDKIIHSAYLALNESRNEIHGRLWTAEVGVLLPFVEERRREIIQKLSKFLHIPYQTHFGEEISTLAELEIGHIEHQIAFYNIKVTQEFRRLVRILRRIRNHLAHFEAIDPRILEAPEVIAFKRTISLG